MGLAAMAHTEITTDKRTDMDITPVRQRQKKEERMTNDLILSKATVPTMAKLTLQASTR